jgi:predicted NACHT family NTPase
MFRRLPRHQLVILGAPGAGKSALALLFTLKVLATREEGAPVPVLLSLSSWDPRREHLLVWIARRIVEDYPGLANADLYGQKAPWRLVSEGRIIPILDGLDEIPSELRGESRHGQCCREPGSVGA